MKARAWCGVLLATAFGLAACTTRPDPLTPWAPSANVAVLVLDNFQKTPTMAANAADNCAHTRFGTNNDGANEVGGTGAGDALPPDWSHGQAVFEVLKAELTTSLGEAQPISDPDRTRYGLDRVGAVGLVSDHMVRWSHKGYEIALLGVDTDKFTTTTITGNLRQLVTAMSADTAAVRFQSFVANMSFVVAPCNVEEWLDRAGEGWDQERIRQLYSAIIATQPDLKLLQDALTTTPDPVQEQELLAEAARRAAVDMFYSAFVPDANAFDRIADEGLKQDPESLPGKTFQQIYLDPLRLLFEDPPRGTKLIPVAAAGNGVALIGENNAAGRLYFDFALAPAMWPNVVSVSATEDGVKRAAYSNSGEVMMLGHFDVPTTTRRATGTSFAAPRMSAVQTMYLLGGDAIPCGADTPPLGYATEAVMTTSSWRNNWRNLTLDAAKLRCPDFP